MGLKDSNIRVQTHISGTPRIELGVESNVYAIKKEVTI